MDCEKIGYELGKAHALFLKGELATKQNDNDVARDFFEQALSLYGCEAKHELGKGNVLFALAELDFRQGQIEEAHRRFSEALRVYEALTFRAGQASAMKYLAELEMLTSEGIDEAQRLLSEAVQIYAEIGQQADVAHCLRVLGMILFEKQLFDDAIEQYDKSLELYSTLRDTVMQAAVRLLRAFALAKLGRLEECAKDIVWAGEIVFSEGEAEHQDWFREVVCEMRGDIDEIHNVLMIMCPNGLPEWYRQMNQHG